MTTDNPYVGPQPFQEKQSDRFFGRDREADELLALALSEQLTLFYAQSGAGKSSLVNTCLIPDLRRKGFDVLLGRVGGDAPSGFKVNNIFSFNLIQSLATNDAHLVTLSGWSLSNYFINSISPDDLAKAKKRRVLIIDQFEELFSTHPEAWERREAFFQQLAQVIEEDPRFRVILVMREDYIASLDPYAHILPGRLRMRYYMQQLEYDAALKAVKEPVKVPGFSRPYVEGVAEKLVDDLRSIKVVTLNAKPEIRLGQFVEPLILQVICQDIWKNLPAGGSQITENDIQKVGDVDEFLKSYYARRMAEVSKSEGVNERKIRKWFVEKLISPTGVRNMVLLEPGDTSGGLENNTIRALSDLIRAEQRGGSIFYELTHDRLVEPILANNKKWFEENSSPLQRQAALWNDQGRSEHWLLADRALDDMEIWAKNHSDEVTNIEKNFLAACQKKQEVQITANRERAARRQRRLLWGMSTAFLVTFCLLMVSGVLGYIALSAKSQAEQASENERRQADLALAGKLAAQSIVNPDSKLSLLLSLQAIKFSESPEVLGSLFANLVRPSAEPFTILTEHTDDVNGAVFSPYGDKFVTVSDDAQAILWNFEGTEFLTAISSSSTDCGCAVLSVAFSPDGEYVAAGTHSSVVLLSDLDSSDPNVEKLSTNNWVNTVTFSPDGKLLAAGDCAAADDDNNCTQGEIRFWDMETLQPISEPLKANSGWIRSIVFSPNGRLLASGGDDERIFIWDISDLQTPISLGPLHPISGDWIESLAFSPDGTILASAGGKSIITLWDVETRKSTGTLAGHASNIHSVAFSPDGTLIASASSDNTILIWNWTSGALIGQPLISHTDEVTSVAFSPDGKKIISAGKDDRVIIWNLVNASEVIQILSEPNGAIWGGMEFDPASDGNTLAVAGYQNISLWDLTTNLVTQTLSGHTGYINSMAYDPSGQLLASASCGTSDDDSSCIEGELFLWDLTKNPPDIKFKLRDHEGWLTDMDFSPDGKHLVTASYDGTVNLWDVESGKLLQEAFAKYGDTVNSITYSPNGRILAVAPSDKERIELWDMTASPPLYVKAIRGGHKTWVSSLAFNRNGDLLASGDYDHTIVIWEVADLNNIKLKNTLVGHKGGILTLAFDPSGKLLASGDDNNTVILWDVETANTVGGSLLGHTKIITRVAFRPDGKTLASGGTDGKVVMWNLDSQFWKEQACVLANRNLTRKEWDTYLPADTPYPSNQADAACSQLELENAAVPMLEDVENLVYQGNIPEALSLLSEAQKLETEYVENYSDADFWNILCWYGSLNGSANDVSSACEKAVSLEPQDGNIRDSRALNRALLGDTDGAIEDFKYAVQWFMENNAEEYAEARETWVEALISGQNPFTDETLQQLLDE